ncbi:MAG: hypothetical protein CVV23_09160 [Ignavibacteriae bacterium HGW-Ignavibacteriae-2]|jgi:hypothetical protein|nr:DUF4876 domain-containing protein [Bacteroidota bacterium]PKL88689.1 MAG: hypothetical protein CVV23_09160 [Ignavibacteriae bacterium HGW-Ignavibacteriae-2]
MKKKILPIISALFLLLINSCDTSVAIEEKPIDKDRETVFKISLVDKTGNLLKLYGSQKVVNTEVLLKSNSLGVEYKLTSDDEGQISFSGVPSDLFLVSVKRNLTREEMLVLRGQELDFYRLVNSKINLIELRADNKNVIEVPLDTLILDSPLKISEIYACGPPSAGLYFHDKYIEIFNQSDSTVYLDGLLIVDVYASSYYGLNYIDDPKYIHSKSIWKFPGRGTDYPIHPGEFKVCAEDGLDHRMNAPYSVDLSHVSFEFYKDDAPDVDNAAVPNMIKIYQSAGNDWLIGGEKDALVIAQFDEDSLIWYDDQLLLPIKSVLDGVEYLDDLTKLKEKTLTPMIDAGATGGIEFYTGKTMERILINENGKIRLKDDNNSSFDFKVYEHPTPEYHSSL